MSAAAKSSLMRWLAVAALVAAGYCFGVALIGHAHAAPTDVGDIKDAFTLGAFVVSNIFTAGAIYGAVRTDLKYLHDKADSARETAKSAHQRIDDVYEKLGERRR